MSNSEENRIYSVELNLCSKNCLKDIYTQTHTHTPGHRTKITKSFRVLGPSVWMTERWWRSSATCNKGNVPEWASWALSVKLQMKIPRPHWNLTQRGGHKPVLNKLSTVILRHTTVKERMHFGKTKHKADC